MNHYLSRLVMKPYCARCPQAAAIEKQERDQRILTSRVAALQARVEYSPRSEVARPAAGGSAQGLALGDHDLNNLTTIDIACVLQEEVDASEDRAEHAWYAWTLLRLPHSISTMATRKPR